MRSFKTLDAKTNSDISDFSDNFSDISENLHATFQDMESLRRNERRRENLQHIGFAAWRVLQNARKAAIARRNDADAQAHNGMFKVQVRSKTNHAEPQPEASASTIEDPAMIGRSRDKRSTGSEI